MNVVYISKHYNFIYKNCGVAAVFVENNEPVGTLQFSYYNISEINSEIKALVDVVREIDDDKLKDTVIIFPAGKIRKIGIRNILASVDKCNDGNIKSDFALEWERMSSCQIVMSDSKDSFNKEWLKRTTKLARFSLEGFTEGMKVLDIITRYKTLSFNEILRRMKIRNESGEIEKEIARRNESKMRRNGRSIYVVCMTNGITSDVDFCSFDEKFVSDFVSYKEEWFRKNSRALENYRFCMMKSGVNHPSQMTEEKIDGTGITLEKFKEIDKETVHGKYNEWFFKKVSIKKGDFSK